MSKVPLSLLREKLAHHNLDGVLIPHQDCYQGEYLAPCDEWISFFTHFTGSAGFLIILKDQAALFVDGRYTLQAKNQADSNAFELHALGEEKEWLKAILKNHPKMTLGYDPWNFSSREIDSWSKLALPLKSTPHFLDDLWKDRPSHPKAPLFAHPEKYAGKESVDKINEIRSKMTESGVDLCILPPESWHWLLNVRGGDLAYTPLSQGFAAVTQADIQLFLHNTDQNITLPHTSIHAIESMEDILKKQLTLCFGYDTEQTPAFLCDLFPNKKAFPDPCSLPRACKNKVELNGAKEAHIQDAVAWLNFWCWFETEINQGKTFFELDLVDKLLEYRSQQPDFHSLSFSSIVGSGPNGAIVHYKPEEETNRKLSQNELLLIDSGGQYHSGTTDITRTLALGNPTPQMKRHYTLVLKGHIAIARTFFPKGTNGGQLDVLARIHLWMNQLDYGHGTGHGVGSFLSVHEGPQRISKLGSHPLHPGMILSNEPGYYLAGEYGIRIENLVYVHEASPGWYEFENLTLVPLDHHLIDATLLTAEEKAWIQDYHQSIQNALSPRLSSNVKAFLESKL